MTGDLVLADPASVARTTRLTREVGEALAKLAVHGTPSQIAIYLQAAGFDGCRGEPYACPIRQYLIAAVPDLPGDDLSVAVTRRTAQISDPGWSFANVELPEAVGAFVRRFDAGVYPDLDTEIPE